MWKKDTIISLEISSKDIHLLHIEVQMKFWKSNLHKFFQQFNFDRMTERAKSKKKVLLLKKRNFCILI